MLGLDRQSSDKITRGRVEFAGTRKTSPFEMLVMDLRRWTSLYAGMDEADIDLIKQLGTKIG